MSTIHDPLNDALEGLAGAAQEVATQCWQWDQLARELWEEFEFRFVPGGDTGWMAQYIERLRRYAPVEEREVTYGR